MTIPPPELLSVPVLRRIYRSEVQAILAIAREVPDLQVNSWWRSPTQNAQVGGARYSQHLLGLAFDLDSSDLDLLETAARAYWPGVVVREPGYLHLQLARAGEIPPSLFEALGLA